MSPELYEEAAVHGCRESRNGFWTRSRPWKARGVSMMRARPTRVRVAAALAACSTVALLLSTGCTLRQLKKQEQQIAARCDLEGTVTTEHPSSAPLVVVLIRREGEAWKIFDSFTRETAGRWFFRRVVPGSYRLAAFEDVNADLVYQPDEPVLRALGGVLYELAPGQIEKDIALVIPTGGRAPVEGPVDVLAEIRARSSREQEAISLGQASVKGEVVTLDDPRFDPENAKKGLWDRIEFAYEVGPGIYFLEEYDPTKIPVLFVHGIEGHPRQFAELTENLDRERFQPWFYYYPSGGRLDKISSRLSELVTELRVHHGFDELFVVAYSMGGLVARSFILKSHEQSDREYVRLFVSISTPWGGSEWARRGVERAGERVSLPPYWRDVAVGSEFLDGIFFEDPGARKIRRRLPTAVAYHMVYGFKKSGVGPSGDEVLTLSTMLRREAQRDALTQYGVDDTHLGIIRNPETFAVLNELLAEAAR
jgi:pimeloyl-ACP methyl ester carboxylesterase